MIFNLQPVLFLFVRNISLPDKPNARLPCRWQNLRQEPQFFDFFRFNADHSHFISFFNHHFCHRLTNIS